MIILVIIEYTFGIFLDKFIDILTEMEISACEVYIF